MNGSGIADWNVIDALPLPNRAVTSVDVFEGDGTANTAYVSFSGFSVNTPETPGHVFLTTDGLSAAPHWTDISGDLPDLPVNRILVQPRREDSGHGHKDEGQALLYAATDIGVFRSRDGGRHWKLLRGLPNLAISALASRLLSSRKKSRTISRVRSPWKSRIMFSSR